MYGSCTGDESLAAFPPVSCFDSIYGIVEASLTAESAYGIPKTYCSNSLALLLKVQLSQPHGVPTDPPTERVTSKQGLLGSARGSNPMKPGVGSAWWVGGWVVP